MDDAFKNRSNDVEIASFYDKALANRLRDYVYGNARVAAAVGLARSMIGPRVAKILDVGCGVGISSAELAKGRDALMVYAVDISPQCVAAATRLFGCDNVVFEVADMREVPRMAPFDLITMFDVYEHIPRDSWPQFNDVLSRSLSPDGMLVLTTPSPLHQDHLARNEPQGLQIVDETVRLEDLTTLAHDVGGTMIFLKYVSIWRSYDYCHSVIVRNPEYRLLSGRTAVRNQASPSVSIPRVARIARQIRVRSRLGFWI